MGQPFSQIHICCYIGNCETHLFTERVVQYNQIREQDAFVPVGAYMLFFSILCTATRYKQQKRVLRWIDYIVQPSMIDEEFRNA